MLRTRGPGPATLVGMTHRDDVMQLEREFAAAMQGMYAVGNGLARLRSDLERGGATAPSPSAPGRVGGVVGGMAAQGPALPPTPPSLPASAATPASTAAAASSVPPAPPARPTAPVPVPVPWYRRDGAVTRVLALSGAVVTLAGVAMLLVLAVRQGWFGPTARVAAGAALAAALGVLGARGGARDRGRGVAVGSAPVALVATGAAAAYLDVVAVTASYGWVPPVVGLVLCVAVAGLGLGLARQWGSEPLAVLLVAGAAVFSPVVADGAGWLLSAVLAVLAVVGWWAAAGRPAPVLTVVRTVPVVLSLLAGAAVVDGPGERLALLSVAVVVLLAALASGAAHVRRFPGDATAGVALGLSALGLVAATAAQPEPTRSLAYVATAALLLLAATTLGRSPLGPLPLHFVGTAAVSGSVAAVLAVVSGAPESFVGTGLLVLAIGHLAVAGVTGSRVALALGAGTSLPALAGWLTHAASSAAPDLATRADLPVAFLDSLLAALLVAVGLWAATVVRGVPRQVRTLTRVFAIAVGLGALTTALVSLGTLAGLRLGDAEAGFTAGHSLSTLGWMVAAAALLLHSLERPGGSDLALRTGLVVAALAVAKLFLFDLAALDGLLRSLGFIAVGLLLLTTGSRYARAWERTRVGA